MNKIIFLFVLMLAIKHTHGQCLSKKQAIESKIKSQRELTYSTKHIPGEPVKDTIESIRVYRYDEKGNLTEQYEYISEGRRQSKIVYTINESGKTTEADSMNGDGNILSKSFYSYDAKGKLLEIKSQDTLGNQLKAVVFTYSESGLLREEKGTEANGKTIYRKIYKYDATGALLQNDYFNADAKLYLSCKFNAGGKLYESKTYFADGTVGSRHAVFFDRVGYKIEEDDFDENGKLLKQFTFLCGPFVGLGLWVKETKYNAYGKSVGITDREFEFFPQ